MFKDPKNQYEIVEKITNSLLQMPEFVLIISKENSLVSSLDANGVASYIPWFVSTPGGHIVSVGMLSLAMCSDNCSQCNVPHCRLSS